MTGDGARWITDAIAEFCPNVTRCIAPFHVVDWANDALDETRIAAWRRTLAQFAEMNRQFKQDGSRNIDTMIGLVMLFCSSIGIPWLGRGLDSPMEIGFK